VAAVDFADLECEMVMIQKRPGSESMSISGSGTFLLQAGSQHLPPALFYIF